jgi:hypothetical protein
MTTDRLPKALLYYIPRWYRNIERPKARCEDAFSWSRKQDYGLYPWSRRRRPINAILCSTDVKWNKCRISQSNMTLRVAESRISESVLDVIIAMMFEELVAQAVNRAKIHKLSDKSYSTAVTSFFYYVTESCVWQCPWLHR